MNVQNNTSSSDSEWTFKTEEEIKAEQNALQMTTTGEDMFVFSEASPMVMNLNPARFLEFYDKGVSVGKLDFSSGKLVFTGDADEAAKTLFSVLKPYIEQFFMDQKNQFIHDANEFVAKLYGKPRG